MDNANDVDGEDVFGKFDAVSNSQAIIRYISNSTSSMCPALHITPVE